LWLLWDWSVLLFRSMLGGWRVLLGRRVWRPGLLRKLGLGHGVLPEWVST
jgi:hypothetical protein